MKQNNPKKQRFNEIILNVGILSIAWLLIILLNWITVNNAGICGYVPAPSPQNTTNINTVQTFNISIANTVTNLQSQCTSKQNMMEIADLLPLPFFWYGFTMLIISIIAYKRSEANANG